MPKFPIEDVEDAYTYYVMVLGIAESTFWEADLAFLAGVNADKNAYDGWTNAVEDSLREEAGR